jgi:hypothetical protein
MYSQSIEMVSMGATMRLAPARLKFPDLLGAAVSRAPVGPDLQLGFCNDNIRRWTTVHGRMLCTEFLLLADDARLATAATSGGQREDD